MIFRNKSFKYIPILFSIFIMSGCSVWENFTTYFNLYYNTASIFDDAEKEILSQQKDIFSNDPIVLQGNSKSTLVKVIEKSSKILQFNANSSYVDEALIMLGKSFFYQGNFQKSKRKFEELLATNPDEEETLESNLWIAKCLFALKENSEASKLIEQVRLKAIEEEYDPLIRESYIEEIKYWLREENYTRTISLANEFVDVYDDNTTRAQVYFELGKLYSLTNDNDNAIIAYENALDNSPDFDLEITATINYAEVLREAGQYEKALDVFRGIRKKDKFKNSFNEIDFEIGKTLVQLGNFNEAYDQFKMVDSVYKNTAFAAASNFELGELYKSHFADYDSAGYFYSKAVTSNPPKEYIEKAKNNNQLFSRYSKIRKDINRFNKQLYYSENPDIFLQDSTAYTNDSLKIFADYLEQKELQDIWSNVNKNLQSTDSSKIKDSLFVKDSVAVRDSLAKVDSLINLGLYNPVDTIGLKQKIYIYLTQKRLLADKNKKTANVLPVLNQNQIKLDEVKFKKNPPLKLKIPIDSAKTILAKNSLELGNLFLAELNVPDSAYNLYETILKEYPSKTYYPNTLYALGSYYLTVDKKQEADSLFQIIYDNYKDKSIVNAAANKLNLPLVDLSFDPAKDQYAAGENLMLEGNYSQSIDKFFNIYNDYPKSPFAPQGLYTTGWILENNLSMPDSAASVYDLLVAKYPVSIYAKKVSKEVTTYKQEKARIQKAIQDSLNAIKNLKTDSTLVANNVSEDQLNNLDEKIVETSEQNQKVEAEKLVVSHADNNNNQKKLEPLWDPRKHFQ
ncbi:MAG: tetratricopeptide repeat protein [Ignavibacteriaceae bacterium]